MRFASKGDESDKGNETTTLDKAERILAWENRLLAPGTSSANRATLIIIARDS